ncbi:glycoside hydrolase family 5 protein [Dothidotthia symphoricarpi CBS 119687]|uniref:glucan 1,3-beta-glucosidase n=1 Tax=Dothidotthia symphoricarpi CBS 119687 TaxID=1392245 RepID=A0A6A6A591_9PLEO|nr:glycoside hydrolase family 5 protein [Dothidotthia symphoricarpi CBS 119687]KAF2125938.1 glycoside hydrolase family 5 protein [Dothidotthia symphoricarpi CBS 119687]
MRVSASLSVALLAGGVAAAPTPDGSSHGATLNYQNQCPFTFPAVEVSSQRYSHDITWSKGRDGSNFVDWRTFKANGANLGGWLEKEKTHDPIWWDSVGGADAVDEWTLCQTLGSKCGPILEERYASFLNTSTIDKLASVGVNTLRIPTTYAAWVSVPGSELYHGNQLKYLKTITQYAISKYNMHVIVGLHSLPGGVNNLDIGEALFHDAWFYNATNLDYSFQAIDGILSFIKSSGYMNAFTIAPINEASDNLAGFGTADGLSVNATNWINTYMDGVLKKIAKVDTRIPMMIQDNFKGASYWAPFYDASANIVFDSHVYYFAAAGTYSQYVNPAVCGQAAYIAQETKFPVFIGEWSLQTMYNNSLAGRKTIFDTQRYAWNKYVAGGTFWTAVSYANTAVDGEGIVRDYWSYIDLINQGVITKATNESYC